VSERPVAGAGGLAALGRLVLRQRLGAPGLGVLVLVTATCFLAPLLARTDPTVQDLGQRFQPPSLAHPLGTDHLGRDLFARIVHGGRHTLGGAVLAVTILSVVGLVVGGLAGYLGGLPDALLMRATDAVLSFPYLVLALALAATFSPSLLTVVVAVAFTWWGHYARVIRGMVLTLRAMPFVEAARAVGGGHGHLLRRHILPGVVPPMIVLSSLDLGLVVLSVAALSYLGLGVQPPAPEWGMMLNESRLFMFTAPNLMLFPGTMIFITVLAANLVGDALRDGLDPRHAGRRLR
jgi:ABC-type dipeptide/oligopeptide/nickel transport system permease subunit